MPLSLIYANPQTGGKIYQCGWREIPIKPKLKNIDIVILAAEELPQPPGFNKNYDSQVIAVPLYDEYHPTPQELLETLDQAGATAARVSKFNQQGRNVIISCHLGLNRSGLITALALRMITKANPTLIIDHIRKRRSSRALSNPAFVKLILDSSEFLV